MKIKSIIAGLLLVISTVSSAHEDYSDQLIEYSNNMVLVAHSGASGSGTFISPQYVITNYHVVRSVIHKNEFRQVLIATEDEVLRVGRVVEVDENLDLALIHMVNYKHPTYAKLATTMPKRLERVWSLGFPAGTPLTITEGKYQFPFDNGTERCAVTSAPIFSGNSGGSTVFIEEGQVRMMGIPTSVVSNGWSGYPHAACSIPQKIIRQFIQRKNPNLALDIF